MVGSFWSLEVVSTFQSDGGLRITEATAQYMMVFIRRTVCNVTNNIGRS